MNRAATAVLLLSSALPIVAADPQTPSTLAEMRDRYRPLLIFTGGDARTAERQLDNLAPHATELRDRQVLIVGVEGTDKALPTIMLSASEEERARQRFHVDPGKFTVILIGKDGGEKLHSSTPFTWKKLQTTIDAMPMRKDEVSGNSR